MRNYKHIDKYLDILSLDIYDQPEDAGHTELARSATNWLINTLIGKLGSINVRNVLDVGCGTGFCYEIFKEKGIDWLGVTLSTRDYEDGRKKERPIYLSDISFLEFEDGEFDLVFARHILEHSPMPLITLMEWRRVSRRFSFIVLPAPEFWTRCGKNHYYVLDKRNWECLFYSSGWLISDKMEKRISDEDFFKIWLPEKDDEYKRKQIDLDGDKTVEFWYLLEKVL